MQLRRWVQLARLAGVAPYRLLGSGQYARCLPLQLLSIFVLTVASVGWLVPSITFHYRVHHLVTGFVESKAETIAALMTSCNMVVIILALWFHQFPALMEIFNSDSFRQHSQRAPSLHIIGLYVAVDVGLYVVVRVLNSSASNNIGTWFLVAKACGFIVRVPRCAIGAIFAYSVLCVVNKADKVNVALRKAIADERYRNSECGDIIHTLRVNYRSSYILCNQISYCFGPQILGQFISQLCWIVYNIFLLLRPQLSLLVKVSVLMEIFRIITCTVLLIVLGERLKSKAAETLDIIHEVRICPNLSTREFFELMEHSQQLFQRPCTINLCGTIELDFSCLFQAGGIAVTYVIVLMQFSPQSMGSSST